MALSVPLSRFTSRVGGGSAFFVRYHDKVYDQEVGLDFDVLPVVFAHVSWNASPVVHALLTWHWFCCRRWTELFLDLGDPGVRRDGILLPAGADFFLFLDTTRYHSHFPLAIRHYTFGYSWTVEWHDHLEASVDCQRIPNHQRIESTGAQRSVDSIRC